VLALAFFFLGAPPAATKTEDEEPDYPRLFSELARNLSLHYLDLGRIHPRPLIEKAFSAIENAAEEIYVENSDPANPIVSVHVGSKAQAFNLSSVESFEQAIQMLENVFEFLKTHYEGESSLNEIRYAAANGFLNGLDPHTLVFSPDAFKDFSVHIEGEISGVGMYVGSRDGKLVVIEVLKGDTVPTPAHKAGFKKGDIITKIGDESTINMSVPEAVDKIRGPRHSTVTLTIKRPSAEDSKKLETHVISVQRDRVEINQERRGEAHPRLEPGGPRTLEGRRWLREGRELRQEHDEAPAPEARVPREGERRPAGRARVGPQGELGRPPPAGHRDDGPLPREGRDRDHREPGEERLGAPRTQVGPR
jgi:hypothetical protein